MSEETVIVPEIKKKEITPDEIYRRSVRKMSARQMQSHLSRKARSHKLSPMDGAWATVLAAVFTSSKVANNGPLEPFIK
jgi:hypothetical protein